MELTDAPDSTLCPILSIIFIRTADADKVVLSKLLKIIVCVLQCKNLSNADFLIVLRNLQPSFLRRRGTEKTKTFIANTSIII